MNEDKKIWTGIEVLHKRINNLDKRISELEKTNKERWEIIKTQNKKQHLTKKIVIDHGVYLDTHAEQIAELREDIK